MPPYRPPDIQSSPHSCKPHQADKFGSLVESTNRYHRDRDRDRDRDRESYHRDRVNSLEKSNTPSSGGFYPGAGAIHSRNLNKAEVIASAGGNVGSIGRRHHGCAASLSEANVREIYGAMLAAESRNDGGKNSALRSNAASHVNPISKQPSFDVSERHVKEKDRGGERDKKDRDDYGGRTKCNNLMDNNTQQALARSYSFVQQQKLQQQMMRRRDRDDDSMHERYLVSQSLHDHARHRLGSSNTSSSNDDSNSSSNSAIGDELGGGGQVVDEEEDAKKKRSNGNPSPPASTPYYGNLLVDADHLLPLQHYILQQAKLSGKFILITIIIIFF